MNTLEKLCRVAATAEGYNPDELITVERSSVRGAYPRWKENEEIVLAILQALQEQAKENFGVDQHGKPISPDSPLNDNGTWSFLFDLARDDDYVGIFHTIIQSILDQQ